MKLAAARLAAILAGFCLVLASPFAAAQLQTGSVIWEQDIQKFEAADKANPPKPGAIVFVGSSSIEHWKDVASDFPDKRVLNRGFGGSRIADSTYYAGRIIVPYKPSMVVFYAGDNDINDGHSAQQVFDDYVAFVARVRKDLPATPIAYISIKPSPSRAKLLPVMKEANAKVRAYAVTHPHLIYIDVASKMLDAGGQPRTELFVEDRLHMNRAGYDLWRGIIAPFLP
ncbi:SGNH/GDSL hydrolase family protein [Rudaea cellulosilytica]|uniref:SGNH/GDSL hydrolase family protein n=1 Tax=Rudaea cellulosilytica TaxID=540746 RepID=UPI00036CA67F|nr:SGNH/GDSL hydrolase family protein [Rudaea cellulosilytica]